MSNLTDLFQVPSPTTGGQQKTSKYSLADAGCWIHDEAIRRWLNSRFYLIEGYPIPVVFASPMDAYLEYKHIWSSADHPFSYLFDLVDEEGKNVYQPSPAPPILPFISVKRGNQTFSTARNFSHKFYRNAGWYSVSDDVKRGDLANVALSRMPQAWDYAYQIDHFASRPDTQAYFIQMLMRSMEWATNVPQTWIMADYPGFLGSRIIRLTVEGDIQNLTETNDDAQIYRTSISCRLEGWSPDPNLHLYPALWSKTVVPKSRDPEIVVEANPGTEDLRQNPNSAITVSDNIPPVS